MQNAVVMHRTENASADPTSRFFADLARLGHEPLFARSSGKVRFDVSQDRATEHWLVEIQNGHVSVSRQKTQADSVIRLERTLFNALATGRANAMAAYLRGQLEVVGDFHLVPKVLQLFPGHRRALRAVRVAQ